jgi:hypothetical protein
VEFVKKGILALVMACFVVVLVSTSVLAATGTSNGWLTNPFLRLWNAIHNLQTQVTNVATTPGPQGEQGPPGICGCEFSATDYQALVARVDKLESGGSTGLLPDCILDSDCDDNNPCTNDRCDFVRGCVYINNSACGGGSGGDSGGSPDGELVVSEIMYNPNAVTDASGEWFELYNAGSSAVNLNDWSISDYGTDSFTIDQDLIVQPNDYVVLCKNADSATNGGIVCDYEYSSFTLGNTADAIIVVNPSSEAVDETSYDVAAEPWNSLNNAGYSLQLDSAHLSSVDNDDGINWCNGVEPITAGDFGTPAGANSECSLG